MGNHKLPDYKGYKKISNYTTTKKVQDTLEVTHNRITQVKASNVHVLMFQYDMFKMEEGQSMKFLKWRKDG